MLVVEVRTAQEAWNEAVKLMETEAQRYVAEASRLGLRPRLRQIALAKQQTLNGLIAFMKPAKVVVAPSKDSSKGTV